MAKDPTKVRVALTGNVWYEPSLSATIVTDPTEPPTTTAVNLGYTTADGVTFSFSRETVDIDGWQVYGEKNWGRGGFPERPVVAGPRDASRSERDRQFRRRASR